MMSNVCTRFSSRTCGFSIFPRMFSAQAQQANATAMEQPSAGLLRTSSQWAKSIWNQPSVIAAIFVGVTYYNNNHLEKRQEDQKKISQEIKGEINENINKLGMKTALEIQQLEAHMNETLNHAIGNFVQQTNAAFSQVLTDVNGLHRRINRLEKMVDKQLYFPQAFNFIPLQNSDKGTQGGQN